MQSYIETDKAPRAIGTYSQAVKVNDTLYVSGQIPLDPQTQELVQGSFREQAAQAFANVWAIVDAAGLSMANVAKVNVSLTDLANFPVLNEVMKEYFKEYYPARAVVQVAALPKGAQVEIEVIAVDA